MKSENVIAVSNGSIDLTVSYEKICIDYTDINTGIRSYSDVIAIEGRHVTIRNSIRVKETPYKVSLSDATSIEYKQCIDDQTLLKECGIGDSNTSMRKITIIGTGFSRSSNSNSHDNKAHAISSIDSITVDIIVKANISDVIRSLNTMVFMRASIKTNDTHTVRTGGTTGGNSIASDNVTIVHEVDRITLLKADVKLTDTIVAAPASATSQSNIDGLAMHDSIMPTIASIPFECASTATSRRSVSSNEGVSGTTDIYQIDSPADAVDAVEDINTINEVLAYEELLDSNIVRLNTLRNGQMSVSQQQTDYTHYSAELYARCMSLLHDDSGDDDGMVEPCNTPYNSYTSAYTSNSAASAAATDNAIPITARAKHGVIYASNSTDPQQVVKTKVGIGSSNTILINVQLALTLLSVKLMLVIKDVYGQQDHYLVYSMCTFAVYVQTLVAAAIVMYKVYLLLHIPDTVHGAKSFYVNGWQAWSYAGIGIY